MENLVALPRRRRRRRWSPPCHLVVVVVDSTQNKITASSLLFVEFTVLN